MKRKKICFLIGILCMLLLTLTNTAYASSRISAYSLDDEEEESFFDVAQYSSRDGISTYAASGNNQTIVDDGGGGSGSYGTLTASWKVGEKITAYFYSDTGLLRLIGSGSMNSKPVYAAYPGYKDLIKKVYVGKGITFIGYKAFSSMASLQEVDISGTDDVGLYIGDRAFYCCSFLKKVTFPNCEFFVGVEAFEGCASLKELDFPTNLGEIRNDAFKDCTSLEKITFQKNNCIDFKLDKEWSGKQFDGCPNLKEVIVYCGMENYSDAIDFFHEVMERNDITLPNNKYSPVYYTHTGGLVKDEEKSYDPTCTQDGYIAYNCENCGKRLRGQKVTSPGHNYSISHYTEPTCTKNGEKWNECSACGDKTTPETISMLGHDYVTTATSGTCDNPGTITQTCNNCGDKTTKEGTTTEHVWEETSRVDADCKTGTDGSIEYTCKKCGTTDTKAITASHILGARVVAQEATCTEPGYWRLSLYSM